MSDYEGTSTINLGLASSLLSRFDLVLILRDDRNTDWDTRVANHIFFETGPTLGENLYDLTQLQAHFAAVRDFDPIVTDRATRILKAYYLACRADEERDAGRTTLRFNDSLYRLAKAHAKLLFRNEVTEIDAALVVMLMESSFGFGRILQPKNVLYEDLPLGPSNVQISELMERLGLDPTDLNNGGGGGGANNGYRNGEVASSANRNVELETESSTVAPDGNPDDNRENVPAPANDRTTRKFKRCLSNENVPTKAPVSVLDSRCTKSQPVQKTLRPLQNIEMNPYESSSKRFRTNYDDDELDQLFTLDDIVPSEGNNGGRENLRTTTSSQGGNEETEQPNPRPNRFRIFNRNTDEDLAALDDLDF